MNLHRATFKEVARIVRGAELPPSYFFEYMGESYATAQAVAVRRQAETGPRVRTLGQLIAECERDAVRLTRDAWVTWWDSSERHWLQRAERAFAKHFGGVVGEHLDPAIARADLRRLETDVAPVKVYVDEHVAHADVRPRRTLPTFADLDRAIDTITSLMAKYYNLLTACIPMDPTPVMLDDWQAVFRRPWLERAQGS